MTPPPRRAALHRPSTFAAAIQLRPDTEPGDERDPTPADETAPEPAVTATYAEPAPSSSQAGMVDTGATETATRREPPTREQPRRDRGGGADPGGAPRRQPTGTGRIAGGRKSVAGRTTTVTFLDEDEFDRVKYAFAAAGLREGFPSLNTWMCDAIIAATEELERRYNGGRHFTAADDARRRRR